MSLSKFLCRFFVLLALAPFLFVISRAGEIIEGDLNDAMVTKYAVNSLTYHTNQDLEVGPLYNAGYGLDIGNVVEAFPLPYLAPGQQIVGASISFYLEQINETPTYNVQLYGLGRVSTTNPTPVTSDWYEGTSDPTTSNVLLNALLVTPQSATNKSYSYSGSNLVSFVQQQVANSAFSGINIDTPRYVFFRLSPDGTKGTGYGTYQNYQFSSSRHGTRTFHPTLSLTVSNGITNVAGRLQFSFSLPQNSVTSAGVYNTSTGALIRTLWNNIQYQKGNNYGFWDGNDDSGNPVATGSSYQIKLIYHNVQYIWQGVVGNTSADQTGTETYRSLIGMQDMTIAGGQSFYTVGYNEQQDCFHYFTVGSPQVPVEIEPTSVGNYNDIYSSMEFVAADGTHTYWAKCVGGISPSNTYVIALNQSDGSFYTFPSGTVPTGSNQQYTSCVDFDSTAGQPNSATGLAVQQTGNDLFVSHGNLNVVRVFDKLQGTSLGSFTVANPGHLSTTADGDVWVVSNGTTPLLQRYTFANGTATLKATITGLVDPVGVCVSADDSIVVVADGGSSQQIKAYTNSTTSQSKPVWTYGMLGGMTVNGPNIVTNCFDFSTGTYVAFQSDNTFWVGDQGSGRALHFSISGTTLTYKEQIVYKAISYQSTVDVTDATRVFNRFLEYSVNYSLPLGGTNGSWKLVKNWLYGLPNDSTHSYVSTDPNQVNFDGLLSVVTLSNGHTYGLLLNYANNKWDLAELSASGPARLTGDEYITPPRLYPDGTFRFNLTTSSAVSYYSEALTGFDALNNPKWGPPTLLASAPVGGNYPQTSLTFPERTEVTATGMVAQFDPTKTDYGYHLGGIPLSGKAFKWLASPSTASTYTGWFPQDGHFDVGNGVNYAGNVVMALGRNLIYGYHGENWKNSEASQWVNYMDNGLMVGRFGTLGINVSGDTAVTGFSGNSFAPTLVTGPDGNTYLFHNEECAHGGTVRWLINGWDGITEMDASSTIGATASLSASTAGPTVLMTSPISGTDFVNAGNVTLSVSAASSGASIVSVQFFDGTTSLGTVSSAPWSLNVSGLAAGTHSLTAKATDSNSVTGTSAPVTITVGSDGSNTPPPAPASLTNGVVTYQSVTLNWVQPTISTTSSTTGQMINLEFVPTTDTTTLKPTDVAGAPAYASSNFNLVTSQATNGSTFVNWVNNSGVTFPNMGLNLAVGGRVDSVSNQTLSGTAKNLFLGEAQTDNADPAITITSVPYASYDLVVYSLAENVSTSYILGHGAQTTSVTVNNGATSSTVQQSFNAAQTGYTVATVPFGSSKSTTNQNAIVFQGMTSQWFILQGASVEGVQIVERPYDQGVPTTYNVQRALAALGVFTTVGTTSAPALTYTDTSVLLPSTTYLYRIQAVNKYGASAYSNTYSVTTPAVTSPLSFAAWQALNFTAAELLEPAFSGPNADPYGSGVPNLLAYALQLSPSTARPSDVPHPVLTNGYLTMTYFVPLSITDLNYIVEVSPDLINWNSGAGYTTVLSTVTSANGNTITIQDNVSTTASKRFMRLRVTQ